MFSTFIKSIVIISTTLGLQGHCATDDIGSEMYNEIPCLIAGGICIPNVECPTGKRSKILGLCPLQEGMEIGCCYSLPLSEKRCHHRGGLCVDQEWICPEDLTFKEARDCEITEKCCILVH